MPIRGVLFDIGGVLAITPPTGWRGRWEVDLGLPPGELGRRLGHLGRASGVGSITSAELEAETARLLALDTATVRRLLDEMWQEYLGHPNHELLAFFDQLRPQYRTGILSNSGVGAREREHERYRFADRCDVLVYSHEAGIEKPDPRIYRLACERLGLLPGEVVLLDDTPACVEGARAVGLPAVRFEDTAQALTELRRWLTVGGEGLEPPASSV